MKQKTEDVLTAVIIAVCLIGVLVAIIGATIGLWGSR